MSEEENVVVEEEKPSKKPASTKVHVVRINSGRGGVVRLRSTETGEIRFFNVEDVNMNLKTFNISEELWKKGK